jgi:hypothetical protein
MNSFEITDGLTEAIDKLEAIGFLLEVARGTDKFDDLVDEQNDLITSIYFLGHALDNKERFTNV